MQLKQVAANLTYECICGSIETEVTGLVYDSRKVIRGSLFICIQGANYDGHIYAREAVFQGASTLVISKPIPIAEEWADTITVIKVEDTRFAMALMAAAYFDYPAAKLNTIGITGTKGKTTAVYLMKSILEQAGYKVGLIGTIETIIGQVHLPADNTTPESYIIQESLDKMVKAGCDTVVMEVSSQGLKHHRTAGIIFDFGIFTNLSPDHIGTNEHESFEEYLECKRMLFRQCRVGIVNADDEYVQEIIKGHTCRLETFGISHKADIQAENLHLTKRKQELGAGFRVTGLVSLPVELTVPGIFSVYNALAAIAVCRHFHVSEEVMQKALSSAKVKGRMEPVKVSDSFSLLIDYAHNAVALDNLLTALREYEPGRLVCVFGCGGNRSRLRRFEMGEISGRLADVTIITSDNPRYEEPQSIIDDIVTGIKRTGASYIEICDRKEAIAYAISQAETGDIIVLAGKGHEVYQEIKGVKYPMDERVLIQEIIKQ